MLTGTMSLSANIILMGHHASLRRMSDVLLLSLLLWISMYILANLCAARRSQLCPGLPWRI